MKLNTIGDYTEVKELYMGVHMVSNPNYPDMDN